MSAIEVREHYDQWSRDEAGLAALGASLVGQDLMVRVRLPARLADEARSAWRRDDQDSEDLHQHEESSSERQTRHRACTFALIGSYLEHPVIVDGDFVIVDIPAQHIGIALGAADDASVSPFIESS